MFEREKKQDINWLFRNRLFIYLDGLIQKLNKGYKNGSKNIG